MPVSPVSVTVPADAGALRVIRVVAGGTAAAAGLVYDRIDDLRLGIDEAAGLLLRVPGASRLACEMWPGDDRVDVRIDVDGQHSGPWPPADWDSSLAARVLTAVAHDVAFDHRDGRRGLSFAV